MVVVFRSQVLSGMHRGAVLELKPLEDSSCLAGNYRVKPSEFFLAETCGVYPVSWRREPSPLGSRSSARSSAVDSSSPSSRENSSVQKGRVSATASSACGGAKESKLPGSLAAAYLGRSVTQQYCDPASA